VCTGLVLLIAAPCSRTAASQIVEQAPVKPRIFLHQVPSIKRSPPPPSRSSGAMPDGRRDGEIDVLGQDGAAPGFFLMFASDREMSLSANARSAGYERERSTRTLLARRPIMPRSEENAVPQ